MPRYDRWDDDPWGGGWGYTFAGAPDIATDYRLVLAERSSEGLGAEVVADVLGTAGVDFGAESVLRWRHQLNGAGSLEFTLPTRGEGVTPDVYAPGQRELHLYRDDGAGERLVWAGHLWVADVSHDWVRFMGLGWYEALRHREVSIDFYRQHADPLTTAWQLIDYTQSEDNGDLGIRRFLPQPAIDTTRTVLYCAEERQNVAQAIEDLADADVGFDFEVTPNKRWKVWTPERGEDLTSYTLETSAPETGMAWDIDPWGTGVWTYDFGDVLASGVILDARTTVQDLSYQIDATQVANEIAGIGERADCEPIHFDRVSDDTSLADYGLMQSTVSRPDIHQDSDRITGLARKDLRLRKRARKTPNVGYPLELGGPAPVKGDFDLGDTIGLTASLGYASFTDRFRVTAYTITVNRIGREYVGLELDAAV